MRPVKVQIDNERLPVLADKPLELVCRAFGSRPAALISWWRGSERLGAEPDATGPEPGAARHRHAHIQESLSADANVTTSTLTIVPTLDDAGQTITCRAHNGLMPAPVAGPLEDSWRLEVHHLPRVTLALGDKLVGRHVREGHDVYFECSVQAQPAAHELRWWLNGKELEANVSSGVIISNQSLVLQRVSRRQRGRYTCSAINSVGEAHSNGLQLHVQHAPYCRDDTGAAARGRATLRQGGQPGRPSAPAKTHYGAARMEPLKVECHVEAEPADSISYKWAFVAGTANSSVHQQPEWSGQHVVYLDQSAVAPVDPAEPLVSVATYTPRSELDYGTLLCWAQNSLGTQLHPCAYQIVPAERPEPLRNCRLLNATESQLAVACEPGYDGGIGQSFHMEVYESRKRELVANVSSVVGAGVRDLAPQGQWSGSDERDQLASDEADQAPAATNSQPESLPPASLVSGDQSAAAARQQKQRHSHQLAKERQQAPAKTVPHHHQAPLGQQQRMPAEAVFLTEPQLVPATDYILSIYSANSKGASKPVAFTATTANHTRGAPSSRDGRRAGKCASGGARPRPHGASPSGHSVSSRAPPPLTFTTQSVVRHRLGANHQRGVLAELEPVRARLRRHHPDLHPVRLGHLCHDEVRRPDARAGPRPRAATTQAGRQQFRALDLCQLELGLEQRHQPAIREDGAQRHRAHHHRRLFAVGRRHFRAARARHRARRARQQQPAERRQRLVVAVFLDGSASSRPPSPTRACPINALATPPPDRAGAPNRTRHSTQWHARTRTRLATQWLVLAAQAATADR